MSDLAARFARLTGEYDSRKRAATALVERWDWYTWPGLDMRPLHFERDLLKPGRRLDARPPVDRDVLRIGFDADGRAVVTEEYSGFLHGRLYYETFVSHEGDVVEAAHFDTDGPIYLHEYRFEDELMRSADTIARGGSGRESYAYTGGQISRVEIEHDGRSRSVLMAEHYDGGLVRIVEVTGRRSQVRYERPPAGFDLEAACRAVEDAFLGLIPDAVARLGGRRSRRLRRAELSPIGRAVFRNLRGHRGRARRRGAIRIAALVAAKEYAMARLTPNPQPHIVAAALSRCSCA